MIIIIMEGIRICSRVAMKLKHRDIRVTRRVLLSTEQTRPLPSLLKQLQAKIKTTGPLTCAEYMKEVLLNPTGGYYIHKDAIGSTGDFITSPELSQMFGELIGIWCIHEWIKLGKPSPLQFVEFGPGTGSLLQDVTRVFAKFPDIQRSVSFHLIERSPKMQALQEHALCGKDCKLTECDETSSFPGPYRQKISLRGLPVNWYLSLQDVPRGFSCYVAQEFFDALPIHIFKRTEKQWQEVLVSLNAEDNLQYALSGTTTLAAKILIDPKEKREQVEISAEAGVIIEELVRRITEDGGFALIADYGHNGEKTDTFRAFRSHKLHDPLVDPGTADLTADVDFSYLNRVANGKVLTYGPISQKTFLKNMGIDTRLKKLLSCNKEPVQSKILKGYELLTGPEMGERFKFFSIFPLVMKDYVKNFSPAGFT